MEEELQNTYECIQDDRFLETKTWICGSKI